MLLLWAWLVVGTVAPIEFVHGRNKRRADRSELWAHFIAKYILEEGRRFLRSFIKTAIADGVPKGKVPARPKRARRPSIRDLFNVDFNAARKLNGTSCRVDSEGYWSDNAEAFGALTPEQLAIYEFAQAQYPSAQDAKNVGVLPLQDDSAYVDASPHGNVQVVVHEPRPQIHDLSLLPAAPEGDATIHDGKLNVRISNAIDTPISTHNCGGRLCQHGRANGVGTMYNDFVSKNNSISRGTRSLGHVNYARQGTARPAAERDDARALRTALQKAFLHTVSRCGGESTAWPSKRFLLEIIVESSTSASVVKYCHCVCGALQAGLLPFRLNVIECAADDSDLEGFVLRYCRKQKYNTHGLLPFVNGEVTLGMLAHFTLDDWTAEVVPDIAGMTVLRLHQLSYLELGGDRFKILKLGEASSSKTLVLEDILADAPDGVCGDGIEDLGVPPIADDDDAWDVLPNTVHFKSHSGMKHATRGDQSIADIVGASIGVAEEDAFIAREALLGFSDDEEMSQGSESDDTTVGVANEVDQGDEMEELAEEDKTEEVLEEEGEIEAVTPDNCIRVLEGA